MELKYFFDGAFGTYFYKTVSPEIKCEEANISMPESVFKIHREYLEAGATALKTNTYGVNKYEFPEYEYRKILIESGWNIASKACEGYDADVFADIGYISQAESADDYIELADIFIKCGAKRFIFETLSDSDMVLPAVKYIKETIPDSFIVISFAVSLDGYTQKGYYYKNLISKALKIADASGLNCICGAGHMKKLLSEAGFPAEKLSAMPNSGYPSSIGGRTVYRDNAEYYSDKICEITKLGVGIIGGCCGTTPNHIRLAKEKIKKLEYNIHEASESVKNTAEESHSLLEEKLRAGKKVIAVEVESPVDKNSADMIREAMMLKHSGADVITISDSPLSRTRADSIMMAAKIKREVSIDVMPHITCRDRNDIAIKGSLIAASIEDITNIFAITGDPISSSERSGKKGVFAMNSYNLISMINEIGGYFCGGAINVNAVNFNAELERAVKKEQCGAKYFMTQTIYTDESINNLKKARERLNGYILAGIMPVASYKNAVFLNNEVVGVTIPAELIESMKNLKGSPAREASVNFSYKVMKKCMPYCDGFYFMIPLRRTDMIIALIDKLKKQN